MKKCGYGPETSIYICTMTLARKHRPEPLPSQFQKAFAASPDMFPVKIRDRSLATALST